MSLPDWPATQRLARRVAFDHYLRRGSVPRWIADLAEAPSPVALALNYQTKYRADQSRVPAGIPTGGQFAAKSFRGARRRWAWQWWQNLKSWRDWRLATARPCTQLIPAFLYRIAGPHRSRRAGDR